jgi:hypothetical protein
VYSGMDYALPGLFICNFVEITHRNKIMYSHRWPAMYTYFKLIGPVPITVRNDLMYAVYFS